MMNKTMLGSISLAAVLTLSACASETTEESSHDMSVHDTEESTAMEHSSMNHSSDGEIPEGLQEASSPTFPVGSKVVIQADHMEGMIGAEATIVGAYNTIVYTVSYTPSNGDEPVTNHKWVIHEELAEAGEEPFEPGAEVNINADHMEGMQEAAATIDSAIETTVYMVDYISTNGEKVTNHKWVTENELSAVE